eukprot:scaffold8420_cov112-Isochrysis_galbana.AAC.3
MLPGCTVGFAVDAAVAPIWARAFSTAVAVLFLHLTAGAAAPAPATAWAVTLPRVAAESSMSRCHVRSSRWGAHLEADGRGGIESGQLEAERGTAPARRSAHYCSGLPILAPLAYLRLCRWQARPAAAADTCAAPPPGGRTPSPALRHSSALLHTAGAALRALATGGRAARTAAVARPAMRAYNRARPGARPAENRRPTRMSPSK